jgi:AcrR family transcriptional regulator
VQRKEVILRPEAVSPGPAPTVPAAPRRRKAARRAEILAAAEAVFAAKPFESASISEIAARAGCVEGTIYTYFKGKRDLFDTVLAEFYDRLIADIAPRFESIRGTRDRLSFLIARHLQIAVDDPGIGQLIMREARSPQPYFGSKLHALNRRYSRFLQRTLAEGIERGDLRADLDPVMARDLVFGGAEHWVWNERGRQRAVEPAKAADAMVAMLLGGWQAPRREGAIDALARRMDRLEAKVNAGRRR